jgi:nucleoside-diphosphate-sugar epimerase
VLGQLTKSRWIFSCCKQLLDRVIWAYGAEGKLDFTLFRPFNWIGPGLDRMTTPKEGSSRVLTQFLGNIVRGENIQLVDGGTQRRCFTFISEGIDCLMRIIANPGGIATGKIYNVGNPRNDLSVRELAELMLSVARTVDAYKDTAARVKLVEVSAERYYGAGYQDVRSRVPWIENTTAELGWTPSIDMPAAVRSIFESYRANLPAARALVEGG